jgi:spermidine/putrescine-binding protein
LWRPELAGKISMVDSPREVIGAVLKQLGSSYNTIDMETEVSGGREAVLNSVTQLQKQVCTKYCLHVSCIPSVLDLASDSPIILRKDNMTILGTA